MLKDFIVSDELPQINDKETIDLLKHSDLPCVLWGAGEVAEKVYLLFSKNNIKISDIWVDGDSVFYFHEYQVLRIEEVLNKYSSFNVIMGHGRYDLIENIKNKYQQIKHVYYLYNSFGWDEWFDFDYFISHENDFQEAFDLTEDDISKEAYIQYIKSRVFNNPLYIKRDCIENGYFNNRFFKMSSNEALLEIGAFDGNIIKKFLNETQETYKQIIAIEPEVNNFCKLKEAVKEKNNINIYNIGCWNEKTELKLSVEGTGKSSHIDLNKENTVIIPVDTIDNIIGNNIVTVANIFVQTGIEEILRGAQNTIANQKPKLIIGIGLRKEQAYNIPKIIKAINPSYKIYYLFFGGVPSRFSLIAI